MTHLKEMIEDAQKEIYIRNKSGNHKGIKWWKSYLAELLSKI